MMISGGVWLPPISFFVTLGTIVWQSKLLPPQATKNRPPKASRTHSPTPPLPLSHSPTLPLSPSPLLSLSPHAAAEEEPRNGKERNAIGEQASDQVGVTGEQEEVTCAPA